MTSGESVPIGVDPEFFPKLRQQAQAINRRMEDLIAGMEIGASMREVIRYALEPSPHPLLFQRRIRASRSTSVRMKMLAVCSPTTTTTVLRFNS